MDDVRPPFRTTRPTPTTAPGAGAAPRAGVAVLGFAGVTCVLAMGLVVTGLDRHVPGFPGAHVPASTPSAQRLVDGGLLSAAQAEALLASSPVASITVVPGAVLPVASAGDVATDGRGPRDGRPGQQQTLSGATAGGSTTAGPGPVQVPTNDPAGVPTVPTTTTDPVAPTTDATSGGTGTGVTPGAGVTPGTGATPGTGSGTGSTTNPGKGNSASPVRPGLGGSVGVGNGVGAGPSTDEDSDTDEDTGTDPDESGEGAPGQGDSDDEVGSRPDWWGPGSHGWRPDHDDRDHQDGRGSDVAPGRDELGGDAPEHEELPADEDAADEDAPVEDQPAADRPAEDEPVQNETVVEDAPAEVA